jgi:hypothetical protein
VPWIDPLYLYDPWEVWIGCFIWQREASGTVLNVFGSLVAFFHMDSTVNNLLNRSAREQGGLSKKL